MAKPKKRRGAAGRAEGGNRAEDAGPRMDDLADLTPENVRRSRTRGPTPAEDVDPQVRQRWEERAAAAQDRKGQRTKAPFIVLGAGAVCVLGVVAWSMFSPQEGLTIDSLNPPVVAALDGGADVYPANSLQAVEESAKFGHPPAVELTELADGTVVLGAEASSPFEEPYAELSPEEFAGGTIPAPRDDTSAGTPVTWSTAYSEFMDDTVFMPAVDTEGETEAVLSAAADADRLDALVVRTDDEGLAESAAESGAHALYTGALEDVSPALLEGSPYTMVAVPADAEHLDAWVGTSLRVWVTGVDSAERLAELGEAGVFGAFAANPYALQATE